MMFHTQCILRLVVGVCVLYSALALEKGVDIFTLASGCFWSVELVFQRIPGVVSTQVGYCGGKTETPSYAAVSRGTTGHAEAVQVQFDPTVVSLDQLLDVFFEIHDPTTPNAQGEICTRQLHFVQSRLTLLRPICRSRQRDAVSIGIVFCG